MSRKGEGPIYIQIPQKPAIIGKKVPIKYYRSYNGLTYNNLTKLSSKSDKFENYDFYTMVANKKSKKHVINNNNSIIPCNCGNCKWINNKNKHCEYLEISILPEKDSLARNIIYMVSGVASQVKAQMHWTLESQNIKELPENIIASVSLNNCNTKNIKSI